MSKKTLFKFITVLFFAGIVARIVFVYRQYKRDYELYKDTFISKQKMQNDFEYVWDFIENGYPFKNVCIRAGADLKAINAEYANRLSEPKNELEYYLFYLGLFNKITKETQVGHLNVYDMSRVNPATKKVQNTRFYENDAKVNHFYANAHIHLMLNDHKLKDLLKQYNVNLPIVDSDREKLDKQKLTSKIIEEKKNSLY